MTYTRDYFLQNRVAIHCPTEEEYKNIIDFLSLDKEWLNFWKNYKEQTCVDIYNKEEGYADVELYTSENFTIIKASEVLKNTQMNKKIIGYKAPFDINGFVKKGEIFRKTKSKFYPYSSESVSNGSHITLPAEIVETWEPAYEELIQTVSVGGKFDIKVYLDTKQIFHKDSNITEFVTELMKLKRTNTVGGFGYGVEDVSFAWTGCEKQQTKLSDWEKVYKLIK